MKTLTSTVLLALCAPQLLTYAWPAAQEPAPLQRGLNLSPAQEDLASAPDADSILAGPWTAFGERDGLPIASGPGWIARFDATGMEFLPALGEDAPAGLELRLRTRSMRVGETGFTLDPVPALPERSEQFIDRRLSGTVTERHVVRPEGIELQYLVHSLPARDGPLVVELDLETDLLAAGHDADGRLLFRQPDYGTVASIGGVHAIDALGRRTVGDTRLRGSTLELEIPAAFLAQAELPLLIDPLVSGPVDPLFGTTTREADLAYSGSTDLWGLVWTQYASGEAGIVYYATFEAGAVGVLAALVFSTSDSPNSPTISYNNQSDVFLVSYVEQASPLGPYDLLCRAVTPGPVLTGSSSDEHVIASGLSTHPQPDSGSESTVADDDVLVLYIDGSNLRSAQVSVPTDSDPFTVNNVVVAVGSELAHPAISKGGGSGGRFLATWQSGSGPVDVRLRGIDRNNNFLSPGLTLPGSFDQLDPDVDGDGNEWLIAFEREVSPGEHDIYARKATWTGSGIVVDPAEIAIEADSNDDEVDPAVAWAGAKYFVAWADERGGLGSGPFEYGTFFVGLDPASCELCEAETLLATSADWRGDLVMGTQVASTTNELQDQVMVAWDRLSIGIPPSGQLQVAVLESIGAGGVQVNTGGGCGAGGTLDSTGPIAVGATTNYTLTGAAPSAAVAILGIAPPTAPVVCGDCAWVPWKFTFVVPVAGGSAFQPVTAPCNALLVGRAFEVQWTVVAPGELPCAISPDIALSNRLAVELGL